MTMEWVDEEVQTPETVSEAPPASEDNLPVEALTEAEPEPVQATEPETITPEPEPEPVITRTPQELQAAFNQGEPLTDEERRTLGEYQRSEENRRRAQAQAAELTRQRDSQIAALKRSFPQMLSQKLNELAQQGETHPRVLEMELASVTESFLQQIEPMALQPYRAAIRSEIYNAVSERGGNAQNVINWMDTELKGDANQEFRAYGEIMRELGRSESDSSKEVSALKAENARLKLEIQKHTVKQAASTVSTKGQDNRIIPGDLTVEAAHTLPIEELRRLI